MVAVSSVNGLAMSCQTIRPTSENGLYTAFLPTLCFDQANKMKKKMSVNLISLGNIRFILMTMKTMIVEKIVHSIQMQKKACIIFDSTQTTEKEKHVFL